MLGFLLGSFVGTGKVGEHLTGFGDASVCAGEVDFPGAMPHAFAPREDGGACLKSIFPEFAF